MQNDEEISCYVEGCTDKIIAGSPIPHGYRHICMKHLIEYVESLNANDQRPVPKKSTKFKGSIGK